MEIANKPVIIVGGGGHAKVLLDTLKSKNIEIIGITDPDGKKHNFMIEGIRVIGTDDELDNYSVNDVLLVNGLGSIKDTIKRRTVYESLKNKGFSFSDVIHQSAVIASSVRIEEGVQVMAGAVIQPGCVINENTIVNSSASIDHDCLIGKNVHIAPGVTLSGEVEVEDNVHVGAGVTIIQGVKIGQNSLIGAGSVVLKDIPANTKAVGVPAKVVKS